MELVIVALILFVGLLVSWLVLPGGSSEGMALKETESMSLAAEQPA